MTSQWKVTLGMLKHLPSSTSYLLVADSSFTCKSHESRTPLGNSCGFFETAHGRWTNDSPRVLVEADWGDLNHWSCPSVSLHSYLISFHSIQEWFVCYLPGVGWGILSVTMVSGKWSVVHSGPTGLILVGKPCRNWLPVAYTWTHDCFIIHLHFMVYKFFCQWRKKKSLA